jgi:hypothetical protein
MTLRGACAWTPNLARRSLLLTGTKAKIVSMPNHKYLIYMQVEVEVFLSSSSSNTRSLRCELCHISHRHRDPVSPYRDIEILENR